MMTLKQFYEEIKKSCSYYEDPLALKERYGSTRKKEYLPSILEEWSTGGSSGGNCWNDSPSVPYTSDTLEPEFHGLDAFIKEHCPNLTYIEFCKIKELVKYDSYSQNEYYGNYTDYKFKYICLDDLYKILQKHLNAH